MVGRHASDHAIEAAAGMQALWETDASAARSVLHERIKDGDAPTTLRQYMLAMLPRLAARAEATEPNLVVIVHALARAEFFRGLRIEDLARLAGHASFLAVENGPITVQSSTGRVFGLVLSGEAEMAGRTIHAGEIFGESTFWSPAAQAPVLGRQLRALVLDVPAVLALAGRLPRLAFALLEQKLETAHAA